MSVININELKARFQTGDQPSNKDFIDLIDTLLSGAIGGGGGMTADQAVFVGPTGNLVSKVAADARGLLGVLSAGTKAAGSADDQILKNHGALTSGQPAMPDGTGWLTYTKDQFLAAMGVGTKKVYYNSGALSKGTPPITDTLTNSMSFAQPSGATYWTEVDLMGVTYLKSATDPATGSISFYWNCGAVLDTLITPGTGVGQLISLACAGAGDGIWAVVTRFRGLVPAQLQQVFPLVITAKLALVADKDGNNWVATGEAVAR